MAFFGDEEEMWKCPKHPSERRPTGVCPSCLRERLLALFLERANVRPCQSSSGAGVGTVGRLSNLIDRDSPFRRSQSFATRFIRSSSGSGSEFGSPPASAGSCRTRYMSFWSIFKKEKGKKWDAPAKKKMDMRLNSVLRRSRSHAQRLKW